MAKLMKAHKWASLYFAEGSAPDIRTIKEWIESDIIKGEIIKNNIYIYEDQRIGIDRTVSNHVLRLVGESR